MNKTIILLAGVPAGKTAFIEKTQDSAWVWNINPQNDIGSTAKNRFYWKGERNDEYYKYLSEQKALVNKYFGYELSFLRDKISDFQADNDEIKTNKEGKKFDNFVLIIHGVSKDLVENLKNEYGVFQVYITRRDLNTDPERHEILVYQDDPDFEVQVEKIVRVLTKK